GGSFLAPKVSSGSAKAGSSRAAISQGVVFMSDPRFGGGTWLGMIMRPSMKEGNGVAGRVLSGETHPEAPKREEGAGAGERSLAERVAIMAARKVGQYLVNDPEICHRQLTFKGTRLPVETVLNWLAKGKTLESILADWPYLKREAVAEAVQLATAALLERNPR